MEEERDGAAALEDDEHAVGAGAPGRGCVDALERAREGLAAVSQGDRDARALARARRAQSLGEVVLLEERARAAERERVKTEILDERATVRTLRGAVSRWTGRCSAPRPWNARMPCSGGCVWGKHGCVRKPRT
jgi:hypothetical protein